MRVSEFLRQSINVSALLALRRLLTQPTLLLPRLSCESVEAIDFSGLAVDHGIKAVVFDKDNTLCSAYCAELHPSVVGSVEKAKAVFPQRVAILSNSAGSCDDPGFVSAAKAEAATGLPVIRHRLKKPACAQEVLDYFHPLLANEICVVGDRVLTDVVFANQAGMLSVLVRPLSRLRDHPVAIVMRLLEDLLLTLVRLFYERVKNHRWQ